MEAEQLMPDVCKLLRAQQQMLLSMGLKQAAEAMNTAIEICETRNK